MFSTRKRANSLCRHEFAVIDALGMHGPLLMNDLAQRVQISSALLSTVAKQLTTRRLARRHMSKTDRRLVHLGSTPAGFALYRALEESRRHVARRLLGAFAHRERNERCSRCCTARSRLAERSGPPPHGTGSPSPRPPLRRGAR